MSATLQIDSVACNRDAKSLFSEFKTKIVTNWETKHQDMTYKEYVYQVFDKIDDTHSHFMSLREFTSGIKRLGLTMNDDECESVFLQFNQGKNEIICVERFFNHLKNDGVRVSGDDAVSGDGKTFVAKINLVQILVAKE